MQRLFYTLEKLTDTESATLVAQLSHIDIIAPQCLELVSGNIIDKLDNSLITLLRQHQIAVMPLVINPNFDQALFHEFLIQPKLYQSIAQQLLAICQKYKNNGLNCLGIQFDFEHIHVTDKARYMTFFKQTSLLLRQQGFKISIAIVPSVNSNPNATAYDTWLQTDWREIFDYQVLKEHSDFVSLMTYDHHTGRTPPGPVAGLDWVERCVKYALSQNLTPEQISLGVPTYSRYWRVDIEAPIKTVKNWFSWLKDYLYAWLGLTPQKPSFKSTAVALSYTKMQTLLADKKASLAWHPIHQVPYAQLTEGNIDSYLYVEDAQAFEHKLALVQRYNLGGISVWRLGFEDPNIWSLLTSPTAALEQKIANMLVLGFEGEQQEQETLAYLASNQIGGTILFKHNIVNPTELKLLTQRLISAKPDRWRMVDQEGGLVQRLRQDNGFQNYPSAKEMATKLMHQALEEYHTMAAELARYHFNVNCAPSVDLDATPACPVIGKLNRSFSHDPNTVVKYADIFMKAHHQQHVLTCLKHFPGHGFAQGDSHHGLTDVTETARQQELLCFYQLIHQAKESKKSPIDMIMTAHLMNRALDPQHPATLSEVILKFFLRPHYDGVVISDDLCMGAIVDHYSFEETVIRAINAGCDLLMFSRNKRAYPKFEDNPENKERFLSFTHQIPEKFIDVVKTAITEGKIQIETINNANQRINRLKQRLN